MTSPVPPYGEAALPPYTGANADPRPASPGTQQLLWFQTTDTTGLYRRRLILPANTLDSELPDPYDIAAAASSTPPPNYTETRTPLYTVRNHGQHSSASPRGSLSTKALRQPDFTVYAGEGDEGPVVATAMFHNKKLQRGIGEVRFFPRSSSGATPATETPSTLIRSTGDNKHAFELAGIRLEWAETGPGEQRPEEPTTPTPASPPSPPPPAATPGIFGKFKKLVGSPPRVPPTSQPPKKTITLVLSAHIATGTRAVATYTELQPIASAEYLYRHVPPGYKDGHCGRLEIHDAHTGLAVAVRDVAVVTLTLLLEHDRRETVKNKNRSWGSIPSVGGSFGT